MKAPEPEAYPYLEEALQGFNQGRGMVKAAGESLAVLGFVGLMQEFCRFVNQAAAGGVARIAQV